MLPLFPLGTVLFPGVPLPLHIFEPRYRELMHDLMAGPEPWTFGVVAIREGHEVGADSVRSLYDVGCTAVVRQVEQSADGRFAVLLVGSERFRICQFDHSKPYLRAGVEVLDEQFADAPSDELVATVQQRLAEYVGALGGSAPSEPAADPTSLSYVVAAALRIALAERQALLETPDTSDRLRGEAELLARELAVMRRLHAMPTTSLHLPRPSQN